MNISADIEIEIVYACPHEQIVLRQTVAVGCTLEQAITQSGILQRCPEIDFSGCHKVGVWNKAATLAQTLRHQDRIEIYRPLIADPKESRRQRAQEIASRA